MNGTPLLRCPIVFALFVMALCIATGFRSQPPTSTAPATQTAATNAAIVPVPRADSERWMQRHESFNERARQGDIDLIFLGDSITQGWESAGQEAWRAHYEDRGRKAVNFGIGGDRTQHILWRLANGNLQNMDTHPPKLVVLMIGTNNSNGDDHTAQEIAQGITAIVKLLREKLPTTKVLLLAIFPRGESPNPQREKNAKASALASKVADEKSVFFMDIGPAFMNADGTISAEVMPDFLHLSAAGYERWAQAIEPRVKQLMGE